MLREIPRQRGHWLLGNAKDVLPNAHQFVAGTAAAHGGLARFRALHRTLYATVRPEDVRHILFDNVENYVKSYHYRSTSVISGWGLLFIDGNLWRRRRRMIQPGFKRASLRPIAEIAARESAVVIDDWPTRQGNDGAIEVVADLRTIALRTITRALLGIGLDGEKADRFGEAVSGALKVLGRRNNGVAWPFWMPTADNRALHDTRAALDDFLMDQIRARRAALAANEETPGGILESYIGDPELSDQNVLDETKTLFTAGFETAATALAWSLGLLADHPEVAEACEAEVDRVLNGRLATFDDLINLPTITAVAEETLRLFPPITQVGRESLAEDDLGGYRLPKGSTILISMYGIQRSPELWDAPEAFRPERFAPERRDAIPEVAYFPFGAGRRTCIGNNFALQEQTAILATILQRYRLAMPPGTEMRESLRVTLQPGSALPIRVTLRKAA